MARKLRVALDQVGWSEEEVKYLWVALVNANCTKNRHEDELTLTFDKFSLFQEGVLRKICNMT